MSLASAISSPRPARRIRRSTGYFAGKDELILAVMEREVAIVASYLQHQMAKESRPQDKIARRIEGTLPPVRPRGGRRRLIVAAVAAVVVLAAAAVGVIALDRRSDGHAKPVVPSAAPITSTVPPAPVAPLPTKVLDGLMLSTDEVAQIMGASQLAVYKTFDTLIDESAVIAQKNCLGSYAPAQIAAYANTGWTAARAQAVHEPGDVPIAFEIVQAVVEFPTAAAAQQLLARQTTQWSTCSGTDFTLTYPSTAVSSVEVRPADQDRHGHIDAADFERPELRGRYAWMSARVRGQQ